MWLIHNTQISQDKHQNQLYLSYKLYQLLLHFKLTFASLEHSGSNVHHSRIFRNLELKSSSSVVQCFLLFRLSVHTTAVSSTSRGCSTVPILRTHSGSFQYLFIFCVSLSLAFQQVYIIKAIKSCNFPTLSQEKLTSQPKVTEGENRSITCLSSQCLCQIAS